MQLFLNNAIDRVREFTTLHNGRLSLRANFSWTLAGNIVYNACQWGLVVVLAKFGSPELVGQYTIALAITAPVFMLSDLGLRVVQATDTQGTNVFGDYLGLRLLCSLLALASIAVILGLGSYKGVTSIVALVSLAKFVESISDISYGKMQNHERLDMISHSLMLRGLFALVIMTVILYLFRSLATALIAQIVVWSSVLWFYDLSRVRSWQTIRPRFHLRTSLRLFWLALPLGIVAGLNSLGIQVPRYAIEYFGSERELGFFAAITSLGVVINLIVTALSQSALPRLSQLYAKGAIDRFVRLLFQLMGLGATIGVMGIAGAALLGKPFLQIVYTAEYAAYANVLVVTMVSVGVVATFTFLGTAVSAARQFSVQSLIQVGKIITIGVACYLLVPSLGIVGAAWATVVGSAFSACAFSISMWQTIRQVRRSPSSVS